MDVGEDGGWDLEDCDSIGDDSIDPWKLLEEHDDHGYQEGFQVDSIGEQGHQGDAANGTAFLQTLLDHLGNVVKTMIWS